LSDIGISVLRRTVLLDAPEFHERTLPDWWGGKRLTAELLSISFNLLGTLAICPFISRRGSIQETASPNYCNTHTINPSSSSHRSLTFTSTPTSHTYPSTWESSSVTLFHICFFVSFSSAHTRGIDVSWSITFKVPPRLAGISFDVLNRRG